MYVRVCACITMVQSGIWLSLIKCYAFSQHYTVTHSSNSEFVLFGDRSSVDCLTVRLWSINLVRARIETTWLLHCITHKLDISITLWCVKVCMCHWVVRFTLLRWFSRVSFCSVSEYVGGITYVRAHIVFAICVYSPLWFSVWPWLFIVCRYDRSVSCMRVWGLNWTIAVLISLLCNR